MSKPMKLRRAADAELRKGGEQYDRPVEKKKRKEVKETNQIARR